MKYIIVSVLKCFLLWLRPLHIQQVLHVGHMNSFLELGDGNLTAKNWKIQMSGGGARERGGGGCWGYKLIGALQLQTRRFWTEEILNFLSVEFHGEMSPLSHIL